VALGGRLASRWACYFLEVATSQTAWWWSPSKHAKKIVWCSEEVIVRGIMLTPWEPRKATLVE
jgi:hypothetical protein